MLREIVKALGLCTALLGVSPVLGQQPLYVPGQWQQPAGRVSVPADPSLMPAVAGESSGAIVPARHATGHDFDAYSHYEESLTRRRNVPLSHRHRRNGGCTGNDCGFDCANCYSRFDIEKRIILSYAGANAHGIGTKTGYGDAHSGQVAAELLPFVLSDGSAQYTRWGMTFLFAYTNYEGDRTTTLRSRFSGNLATVDNGETYSFILGPTIRSDFQLGRFRFSPNGTVGVAFDWTDMEFIAPVAGSTLRSIDRFKFTGFDAGAYIRLMMDFPITDEIAFGVGGEYRYTHTDVVADDQDQRQHMGVVVSLSYEF